MPKSNAVVSDGLWGLLILVGGISFWYYLVGNPFADLALIRGGVTAPGQVVDAWEESGAGDEGGTRWQHGATYTFRLPDGREVTDDTGSRPGRLAPGMGNGVGPRPIEVEYLPSDPSVSRIKPEGSSGFVDWLWRKLGISLFLLAVLSLPGITMLRTAFDGFRHR